MADRLTNVELLLMLSEDVRADNSDWSKQVNTEGRIRYQKVAGLLERVDQAKQLLEDELKWLRAYAPRDQEPLPRIVQKGPANEPLQRQDGNQRGLPSDQVHR